MMKPRICFVITDAVSFNVLCRDQFEYFLQNAEVEMTFMAGGDEAQFERFRARGVGRIIDIALVRRPSIWRDLRSLLLLLFFFAFKRFDLVVYSTPKALLLASVAATITGQRRRIALVRGRVYENFTGSRLWFYRWLDRLALGVSHKALFISHSLKAGYEEDRLIEGSKAVILGQGSSNGVDIPAFSAAGKDRQLLRQELGLSDVADDLLVIVVGRICKDKGIEDIRDIHQRIRGEPVRLVLIGDIEDPFAAGIVSDLLVVPERPIVHLPAVREVAPYFLAADVHLFPSHREGFGNVAIEAAAAGVPTLAYRVRGVVDSVNDGVSGKLFESGDSAGMARWLTDACRASLAPRDRYPGASRWARENFSRETVWRSYLGFYLSEAGAAPGISGES